MRRRKCLKYWFGDGVYKKILAGGVVWLLIGWLEIFQWKRRGLTRKGWRNNRVGVVTLKETMEDFGKFSGSGKDPSHPHSPSSDQEEHWLVYACNLYTEATHKIIIWEWWQLEFSLLHSFIHLNIPSVRCYMFKTYPKELKCQMKLDFL